MAMFDKTEMLESIDRSQANLLDEYTNYQSNISLKTKEDILTSFLPGRRAAILMV